MNAYLQILGRCRKRSTHLGSYRGYDSDNRQVEFCKQCHGWIRYL